MHLYNVSDPFVKATVYKPKAKVASVTVSQSFQDNATSWSDLVLTDLS